MSKAGAVLIALLTTGMAEGDAQKKDLWMFISGMSASLKTLSVTTLSNAPLSFKMTGKMNISISTMPTISNSLMERT
jgi:predicted acetyltransferase